MPKVTDEEGLVINHKLQRYIRVSPTKCTVAPVSYHVHDNQPITFEFNKATDPKAYEACVNAY